MPLLFQLQFTTVTYLWLLASLFAGIGYAALLYYNTFDPAKKLRNYLFLIRTLSITLIVFLLFAPQVKTVNYTKEKPLILIAQDNSASLGIAGNDGFNKEKYQQQLKALETELSTYYEVRTFNFDSELRDGLDLNFSGALTDISSALKKITDQFANRNIGALILGSDGIYNRGANPLYESKNFPAAIYTIALGDTVPKRDLLISDVNYNNIAYLGNQFQIEVRLEAFQARGSTALLKVFSGSGIVLSRQIQIGSNEFRQTVPLTLPADNKGIQQFTIRIDPVSNELSERNNEQKIYVDVIDGRQKVLIIAHVPHPDITAFKQSIEINKNYTVKVVPASEVSVAEITASDLIILHQIPASGGNARDILSQVISKPILFVPGSQSNLTAFSTSQNLLSLTSSGTLQEVTASVKSDFYAFTLSEETRRRISNFGPLLSPFGNYGLKAPASILLTQQIGKLVTDKPLLLFAEDNRRRIGILAGEGIWRWRLEDFQENSNHNAIDELIQKIVQYLSGKEDKRKFRVYPSKNAFDENEQIGINAELYNDAFELVNTPDVNIVLKPKEGKSFSFIFSRTANAYTLNAGTLPPGEYQFIAQTTLGKTNHKAEGQFIISRQDSEFRQSIANHQLMNTIALQTGGKMIYPDQLNDLPGLLRSNENVKTLSFEDRKYEDPVNIGIVFFLILGLLSLEWFLRKRNGLI
jgi:hypothetical protein